MRLQPPSNRAAAGTRCAPPAPRTPVRPAARAGPPVITCTQAVTTRVGDCNCVDPGCSHTVLEWAEVGPRAAATPPPRGARRRCACGPWCAARPPRPRRRGLPRRRTSCRAARRSDRARAGAPRRPRAPARVIGRQIQMVTTCMDGCMSQRTADSISHCSVSRCTWPSSRRMPSPSSSRASRTWYMGRQASDTWRRSLGKMGRSLGHTLGLQPLIHAVAALSAHLVLLAPPPRLRRRAPRLHQLGRSRALLLRCRRAHHRCPQLGG
jgi:hypothetical protein